jgi:hypothetical protein
MGVEEHFEFNQRIITHPHLLRFLTTPVQKKIDNSAICSHHRRVSGSSLPTTYVHNRVVESRDCKTRAGFKVREMCRVSGWSSLSEVEEVEEVVRRVFGRDVD